MEEEFKEFEAKTLDEAIQLACDYFGAERAKLEIEILQDAKSGIFGIVGVRKAKVRARRVHVRETIENILGRDAEKRDAQHERREKRGNGRQEEPARTEHVAPVEEAATAQKQENRPEAKKEDVRQERKKNKQNTPGTSSPAQGGNHAAEAATPRTAQARKKHRPQPAQDAAPHAADFASHDMDDVEGLGYPATPLENLDKDLLLSTVDEVTRELVRPIAGTPNLLESVIEQGRVSVRLDCGEDSGLLIGREGMTLAALQYILSRVVSCRMNASIRVQLDAGDYRRHQEDKLRDMAKALAERARQSGRSYSTRPLSSYHRRIVHLALQDMEDIQSRSSGDGALKRVVISKRRMDRSERTGQQ